VLHSLAARPIVPSIVNDGKPIPPAAIKLLISLVVRQVGVLNGGFRQFERMAAVAR